MKILVDTNVLLRAAQPTRPGHTVAAAAVDQLLRGGHALCVVPQCLYEFYVVATRPVANHGLGLAPPGALAELHRLRRAHILVSDTDRIYPEWEALVAAHAVSGKLAHDARLVAAMQVHGLGAILTFNTADFNRFGSITVLDPTTVSTTP